MADDTPQAQGGALAAIKFAIELGMWADVFLAAWSVGDTSEWPEFSSRRVAPPASAITPTLDLSDPSVREALVELVAAIEEHEQSQSVRNKIKTARRFRNACKSARDVLQSTPSGDVGGEGEASCR